MQHLGHKPMMVIYIGTDHISLQGPTCDPYHSCDLHHSCLSVCGMSQDHTPGAHIQAWSGSMGFANWRAGGADPVVARLQAPSWVHLVGCVAQPP